MVNFEVLRGATLLGTIRNLPKGTAGTGSYNLTFPYNTPQGGDYTIRITSTSNMAFTDSSDAPFAIQPAITVTSPTVARTARERPGHSRGIIPGIRVPP